ncbi:MAG: hypothetical protein EXR77_02675 [Myxococcales bacterium]|nr:hypothetical protein [Myxococcales bacterium]
MAAPQSSMMKNLAKMKFKSFAIKLPVDWQQPQGNPKAKQYTDSFKPSERMAVPDPSKLFVPASVNKYHVDTVSTISGKFEKYIDGICDAICQGWSTYHSTVCLTMVNIAGPVAAGGMLVGPPLTPLILASGPKATANEAKYSRIIATVVGTAFTSWQSSVKVAGMPWYPAFAAFPGPMAPPMPNVPCPIVALVQVNASLQDSALKGQMVGQLGDPKAQHHAELFESVSVAVNKCFTIWTASTMVTNVLGFGPIPTFVPPFVPVGPVVGGMGNQTPGGMA